MWWQHLGSSLCNFQAYNTILITIITRLYIRASGLYPLANGQVGFLKCAQLKEHLRLCRFFQAQLLGPGALPQVFAASRPQQSLWSVPRIFNLHPVKGASLPNKRRQSATKSGGQIYGLTHAYACRIRCYCPRTCAGCGTVSPWGRCGRWQVACIVAASQKAQEGEVMCKARPGGVSWGFV